MSPAIWVTMMLINFFCAYYAAKMAEYRNRSKVLAVILVFVFSPLLVMPAVYLSSVKEDDDPEEVY